MRPSSSQPASAFPQSHQHDDEQPPRQRRRLLTQDDHSDNHSDSDSDSSASDSNSHPPESCSRPSAGRAHHHSRVAGPSARAAPMTGASVHGLAVASASRHPRSLQQQPPPSRHDPLADVEMTDSDMDSDSEDSDNELDMGGAPLVAATGAFQATGPMPTADANSESDSEYLSDADDQYSYDDYESDYEIEDEDEDEDEDDDEPIAGHFSAPGPVPPISYPAWPVSFNNPPQMPATPQAMPHNVGNFMPAGPTDLANLPPLPQPHPGWVAAPAFGFGFDQNALMSNANPAIYGSENFPLIDFLRDWAYQGLYGRAGRSRPPHMEDVVRQMHDQPEEIDFTQLKGDECDIQGMNWASMETTRRAARLRRQYTYRNYVNRTGSDKWVTLHETLSSRESFYRFKRMSIRKDVCLAHFQLRSVLACPTRTHAYYPTRQGVARMNLASRKSETFMKLRDFSPSSAGVSTVDAGCGVLMCGTFNGDYYMKNLDASDKQAYTEGQITSDISGITNHIKIHKPRRSCGPAAAIASNDHGFRLLDLETQKFVQETMYPFALNCTAVSPDRRLRAVVGDHFNVLITNADTGEVLRELGGHRDYGFACDWSDDGWTVATGFQDMAVKIWDARRWCNSSGISTPLCTVRTEMAGARSLHFSPLGSGPPVLVAAEEADFVNVIDAKTFRYKQEIDIFGEIGGVAFANDGQDLNVLCCDMQRGGLLQLQRCRSRRGFLRQYDEESLWNRSSWLPDTESTPTMHEIPAMF